MVAQVTDIDAYCGEVVKVWMENPPELWEGWLDEMVGKLVATCKNTAAKETKKDTATALSPIEDIAEGEDDQEEEEAGINHEWAQEIKEESSRKRWLVDTGKRKPCGDCGRTYYPTALVLNTNGVKVCPTCLKKSLPRM